MLSKRMRRDPGRDGLGTRIKSQYEDRCRFMLPRRTHTIVRLDGKAFHTYTRGRQRPWDPHLHEHLVTAGTDLCEQAQGATVAFVQSDEISVLLTDFASEATEAWFDGNLQKITSVSASVVTARFNVEEAQCSGGRLAFFDARAFTIPDPVEVHNYLVWRQKDIQRNSLSMLAQAHYSAKALHGKPRLALHAMLAEKGVSWNAQPEAFKHGTLIRRSQAGAWESQPAPIFTDHPDLVPGLIARD